jgi:hypothetical protein
VPVETKDVAKQALGEEALTRIFAKAVSMLPAPVVAVTDINDGQKKYTQIMDSTKFS